MTKSIQGLAWELTICRPRIAPLALFVVRAETRTTAQRLGHRFPVVLVLLHVERVVQQLIQVWPARVVVNVGLDVELETVGLVHDLRAWRGDGDQ